MKQTKQTFYQFTGSKTAELITILHIPFLLMCLSFLTIGFGIAGINRWDIFALTVFAYFFGLTAAHAYDQLPGMGSRYVKHLTSGDLMVIGLLTSVLAVGIGAGILARLEAWHLLWIIPLQTFFIWAYPNSKFMKGFFHTDGWFTISFGALPVMAGYYINTLTFNPEFIPWAVVAALIAGIEITLSRYVRKWRKETQGHVPYNVYLLGEQSPIERPERALKLLCLLSYVLALIFLGDGT